MDSGFACRQRSALITGDTGDSTRSRYRDRREREITKRAGSKELNEEKDMFSPTILALILTVTLTAPCSAAGGYRDLLDTPAARAKLAPKRLLNGVALAGKRLVGVGQRGHIVYSDDRGKSWVQAGAPVSSDLVAVHFPSPLKGWAVGHDGVVLHTADGGATWTKQLDGRAAARIMVDYYRGNTRESGSATGETQTLAAEVQRYLDQGADKPFLDVWFENESSGFIVGAFNLVFRTVDGGKSWVPWFDKIDNPKRFHLYAIRPVGPDLFITGEQGGVFKLDRHAGRFKAMKPPYAGTFFGITGKHGAVVAFGMRGNVFRSRDGGASWQKVETGVPAGLTGATVTEEGRIVLVSQAGDVLVSGDDGASFTQIKIDRPVPASAVTALDKNTIELVGLAGVRSQSIK